MSMNPQLLALYGTLAVAVATSAAGTAAAQALPTPLALASQLDLECRSAPPLPPPQGNLLIRQLNPVIKDELPNQVAALGPLRDVCVPVAKNGRIPGPLALPIVQWTDLACYEASAPPVDVKVDLSHLNPELEHVPDETVRLAQLERICVPVRKGTSNPPEYVKHIVKHIDVACYKFEEPTPSADTALELQHLNPVIRAMNLPDRKAELGRARRLCVPVGKGQQPIPDEVRQYVEWIDFAQYDLTPKSQEAAPAFQLPIPLWLHHMNPLFANRPPFFVQLTPVRSLMVPVAKNGILPPQD